MTEPAQKSDLVGVKAAARILGVHGNTIRNWTNNGILPSRRLPSGHRRMHVDDLQRLLEDPTRYRKEVGGC